MAEEEGETGRQARTRCNAERGREACTAKGEPRRRGERAKREKKEEEQELGKRRAEGEGRRVEDEEGRQEWTRTGGI